MKSPTRYGSEAKVRTQSVAKFLDIPWIDVDWPETKAAGYGTEAVRGWHSLLERVSRRGKRPALVYIIDGAADEAVTDKSERSMFGSDEVVLGSRFFHPIRIEAKNIGDPALREKYSRSLPALVFFDADGNEQGLLSGQIAASAVWARLDKVGSPFYVQKIPTMVAKLTDVLARTEKAEDRLAEAKKRVEEVAARKDTPPKVAEEAQKKYDAADAEMKKLEAERLKLLTPVTKEAPESTAKAE